MSTALTMTSISSHHVPSPLLIPPTPTRTTTSISVGTLTDDSITTIHSSPPETPSTSGGRRPHHPPRQTSGDVDRKVSKSKSTSILGFLTVKEPSRLALEQYERDMKRKAAEAAKKSGRPSNINGLDIPTAKLPASVPKVNSKWDGLPKAITEQKKGKGGPGNEGHRRSDMAGPRDHWRRLGNETQASFGTFGARQSGVANRRRSRSLTSRDGNEYPWPFRHESVEHDEQPSVNVLLKRILVGQLPIRSSIHGVGFHVGRFPGWPIGLVGQGSRVESSSKRFSEHPESTRFKLAAPSLRSQDLVDRKAEVGNEAKQPTAERSTQQPSSFEHDLLAPQEPLMPTTFIGSGVEEKSDPLVVGSTYSEAPRIFPNYSKPGHIARKSVVAPWECLEPPKSVPEDTRPSSPPCPVKNILRRAKKKVFSVK
ncbi:MAG: hypothetical protein M1816_001136 [Peltula sp. TS41687]|nr:MAG: hypothetical protein M1816_001136 [Peltula sp. TS41687]